METGGGWLGGGGSVGVRLASGKHTKSYGRSPFIVDFPIKNGGSFQFAMLVHQRVGLWVAEKG